MNNEVTYDQCPVCGNNDGLVTTLSDGTEVRSCRNCSCPMFYIPVPLTWTPQQCLDVVGYKVAAESADAYFAIKDTKGYLIPKVSLDDN